MSSQHRHYAGPHKLHMMLMHSVTEIQTRQLPGSRKIKEWVHSFTWLLKTIVASMRKHATATALEHSSSWQLPPASTTLHQTRQGPSSCRACKATAAARGRLVGQSAVCVKWAGVRTPECVLVLHSSASTRQDLRNYWQQGRRAQAQTMMNVQPSSQGYS